MILKKILFLFISVMAAGAMFLHTVKADEYTQLEEYDFDDIQEIVDSASGETDINFKDVIKKLISGDLDSVMEDIAGTLKDTLFSEIKSEKSIVGQIIVLAVIAAIFTNFSSVLKNGMISETGFFVVYIVLLVLLLGGFKICFQISKSVISLVLDFMTALLPAYFLSVGVVNGATAAGFYGMALMLIAAVNFVYLNFILPLTNVYVLVSLVNNISSEDYFSKTAELIKSVITQTGKAMLAIVMGINVVQGIILPSADAVKNGAFTKLIGAIPGFGNSAQNIAEALLGSSILIKNGIGAAAIVAIAAICAVPLLKLFVIAFLYKISAAVIQPLSDKRITECVDCVASSAGIMLKSVLTVIFLFVISIAIICMITNTV